MNTKTVGAHQTCPYGLLIPAGRTGQLVHLTGPTDNICQVTRPLCYERECRLFRHEHARPSSSKNHPHQRRTRDASGEVRPHVAVFWKTAALVATEINCRCCSGVKKSDRSEHDCIACYFVAIVDLHDDHRAAYCLAARIRNEADEERTASSNRNAGKQQENKSEVRGGGHVPSNSVLKSHYQPSHVPSPPGSHELARILVLTPKPWKCSGRRCARQRRI